MECARSGQAEQVLPGQGCFWEEIEGEGSDGSSEGSLEEFAAWSNGGFEATGPAEANGKGDVWHVATITAADPAGRAEDAKFLGDANNVGALVGADRDSGAGVVPEGGQSWTNVGSFDQHEMCIIGGDQWKTD